MDKTANILRIIFGGLIILFGINGFYPFLPSPNLNEEFISFLRALFKAGYLFPLINLIKILAGLLILSNKGLPLALLLTFPILLNAFLAHLFMDTETIINAAIAFSLNVILIYFNREKYQCITKF